MKINKLRSQLESGNCSARFEKIANLILDSINDWPDSVEDLDDFLEMIGGFVGKPITKSRVDYKLQSVDVLKYAWNVEALTYLQDLLNYYGEGASLEEIINYIKLSIPSSD